MMELFRKIQVLWVFVLFWACSNVDQAMERAIISKPASVSSLAAHATLDSSISINLKGDAKSVLMVSDKISPNYSIVHLETLEDVHIGEVEKVIVSNDHLFVFDKKIARQLFVFDLTGKFIRKVGAIGKGPSEIDNPLDFDVCGDRVFILDRQARLTEFGLDGAIVSQILLPIMVTHLKMLSLDNIFFYTHDRFLDQNYSLLRVDEKLNLLSQDFPLSAKSDQFGVQKAFFPSYSNDLFSKFECDTIYELQLDRIRPKYVLKSSQLGVSKSRFNGNTHTAEGILYSNGIAENSENLIFHFVDGKKINVALYYSQSGAVEEYGSIYDDYFLGALNNFLPVGLFRDSFIFPMNVYDWVNNLESITKSLHDKPKEQRDFFQHLSRQSSEIGDKNLYDNPMLLFTKLRALK